MEETEKIFSAVLERHNVLILGQAGTGKTTLIKKIYNIFKESEVKVKVLACTGISSTLLSDASTVHSFFGLLDGRFEGEELVERVLKDDNLHTIKDRILNTDCIIIDEVSMLSVSSRTFGHIEILCRKVRKSDKPFGGIQFVLSGDLYQLKSVTNIAYGDKGQLFIEHDRFSSLVPHMGWGELRLWELRTKGSRQLELIVKKSI